MNPVMSAIRDHAQPDITRRIEVPEWGKGPVLAEDGSVITPAQPLNIFYNMVTLDDLARVHEADGDQWHHQAARIVCLKSLDENGRQMFKMIDALELRRIAAPDVVSRIALAMIGRLSMDDAAKN